MLATRHSTDVFLRRCNALQLKATILKRCLEATCSTSHSYYSKKSGSQNLISSLFKPVAIKLNSDDINVGAELSDNLKKRELLKILNKFTTLKEVQTLALESGLDNYLLYQAFESFKNYCLKAESLPTDLHIVLSDILQGAGHITDIYPYFIKHAKQIFPHIECIDDLKKISDLRNPANWYPLARTKTRKIIFHAGPTNSGKTHHALERFMSAKSGIYCGPLKLLAAEVYTKTNAAGTPCDLVTGEERGYANPDQTPSQHVSCTVEMANINSQYEVAVIDEIQMMRDQGRGWAWTRALLGLPADEIHICGEAAATDLVEGLCISTGESMEIRRYKRLTELVVEDKALLSLKNVQPGDCIVCFSKLDIYNVTKQLEKQGIEIAVIYGSLPPGTKLAQTAKFNDPNHSCKVLVATDAIGLGLNLHIRRIIFYSLIKPTINEKGEKEMDTISVSCALQIAGRAGRYGTQWEKGFVTTFKAEDLPTLEKLLKCEPEPITQAGLHPTADQIELYAYHLPNSPLSNLMDIFVALSTVGSQYFMCLIEDFKFLADMIQHISLPLRARYVFCCAPINKKFPFVCSMFLKFARQYSRNQPITFNFLCQQIGWPIAPPKTILDLVHLEAVFDVLDLYLWLSYRFMDLFPDSDMVRDMQKELDGVIQEGVIQLTSLLDHSETGVSSGVIAAINEDFELNTRKTKYRRDGTKPQPHQQAPLVNLGKGKLTQRLLEEGLLTPGMISELRQEWGQEKVSSEDNETLSKHGRSGRKYKHK